jgi:hypothetical protein
LRDLLQGDDPWLRACAGAEVCAAHIRALEPEILELMHAADPVCRETAVYALQGLCERRTFLQRTAHLCHDTAEQVRSFAQFAHQRG